MTGGFDSPGSAVGAVVGVGLREAGCDGAIDGVADGEELGDAGSTTFTNTGFA
ncbi:hypothetical protein JMX53_11135 [Cutibacterium avidum]|uniref:hypothetical protein n=1 Tax=Cutibacterium avidum TaxID=33010 RepID=UPI00192AD13C|nr:hypothetical protein [Cutibacterium avidum]QQY14783.1 hypothetical protein JMX53_11135 [Cutibacterium avidum]